MKFRECLRKSTSKPQFDNRKRKISNFSASRITAIPDFIILVYLDEFMSGRISLVELDASIERLNKRMATVTKI